MKVLFFPFFLVQLLLAATPSMAWLLALSFKNWRVVIAVLFVVFGLSNLVFTWFSPSTPYVTSLSPDAKLNRLLQAHSPTLVSFSNQQPSLETWLELSKQYPGHRDVLFQTAIAAYYAGEYAQANQLWHQAYQSDSLSPIFKDIPTLAPLHTQLR